tara:strand:- start:66345 stop:67145 length:801 start_codon:yes stop_codon:yes gene_type:complete
MSAQRYLVKAQREGQKSLRALASGSRVEEPGNDAAGFAISESLRAQAAGLKQAKGNAESAIAFIQTAEGTLNEQNNIMMRLRELAVQSASDTIGEEERGYLDQEFQQLSSEFDRIAKSSNYGGKKLLTGENEEFQFHVGTNSGEENVIKFNLDANTTASKVGIDSLNVLDQDDALEAMEAIDEGLHTVLEARSTFGAAQSRFEYTIDNLSNQFQNVEEARSIIADVDVAEETANFARSQILQELSTSVLAQANHSHERALRLLVDM